MVHFAALHHNINLNDTLHRNYSIDVFAVLFWAGFRVGGCVVTIAKE